MPMTLLLGGRRASTDGVLRAILRLGTPTTPAAQAPQDGADFPELVWAKVAGYLGADNKDLANVRATSRTARNAVGVFEEDEASRDRRDWCWGDERLAMMPRPSPTILRRARTLTRQLRAALCKLPNQMVNA